MLCLLDVGGIQGLADVGQQVIGVFQSHAETYEVRGNAGFSQLLIAKLAVGVAGWMKHTCLGIGYMCNDAYQFERIHEADGLLAASLETEGYYAASAMGQVFLCQRIIFVVGQSGEIDPFHAGVIVKKLGNALGILAVALHSYVE